MKTATIIVLALLFQSVVWAERVSYVVDGDTFVLSNESRVRLSGIDAPELAQPYGREARDYLSRLVADRDIQLDCQERKSYGRYVCNVFVDTMDIQKELVGWGLAFDYEKYSHGKYRPAERFAQSNLRGVWSGGVRPWEFRRIRKNGDINEKRNLSSYSSFDDGFHSVTSQR